MQASFYCSSIGTLSFLTLLKQWCSVLLNNHTSVLNSIQKVVKWKKKSKIDKHMELRLYRQPIINFQRPSERFSSHILFIFAPEQLSTLSVFNVLINNNNHFSVPSWREFYLNFINSAKEVSTFSSDNSFWILQLQLNTPFPIKDFISICRDLNFFDVTLPLFCKCCSLNNFLKSRRKKSILTEM